MNVPQRTIWLALMCLLVGTVAFAQTTGDYRTAQSGDWHTAATWERWNGSAWITPAPSAPTYTDEAVTILNGHAVAFTVQDDSVDQMTVDAGGMLTIGTGVTLIIKDGTGDDLTANDSVIVNGALDMNETAVIVFGATGVYVHGVNGGTVPTATWNSGSTCIITGVTSSSPANMSQGFSNFIWDCAGQSSNVDWGWYNNTITGNVTVENSGASRARLTSPGASPLGDNTITIQGNMIVKDDFESNGSGSSDTINVNTMGDLTVTAGNFGISRGSGPNVNWNHFGDLTVTGTTLRNSGGEKVWFTFAKNGTQTLTLSGVGNNGDVNLAVDTNSTIDLTDGPDAVDFTAYGFFTNYGTMTGAGTLSFANGATYVHAQNGGTFPTATWETGSTAEVTGVVATAPSNMNQNFFNFVWNCAAQSSNRDWGWFGNTIAGDITIKNTGSVRAYMTSPSASPIGPNTITVMGNITLEAGQFSCNGSSSTDTIIVESMGDIIATGGSFSVSRGSGPNVMWNVYGNMSFDNAEFRNSGGAKASYFFKKQGTQTLTLNSATDGGGGLPIVVDDGSTLDLGTNVLIGNGAFRVAAGGNLLIGHANGATDALQNTGGIAVDSGGTLVYNGTVGQLVGAATLPDSIGGGISVTNMTGVSIQDTLEAGFVDLATGTTFTVDTVGSISVSGGTVAGHVNAIGTFTGSGLTFADGSKYTHDHDGGTAPTATWQSGSTIEVTGSVGNAPSNLNQDFYNFVWNTPLLNSNKDWGWANNTIGGTVTVSNTGSARIRMTSPGATPDGPNVITLMGDVVVDGGSFESNGSGSPDTITVEHHGNITSTTTGVFAVSRGSGPMVYWNVYGDFTLNGSEVRNSGGDKANFYFVKQGTQNLNMTGVTFGGGGLPIVVGNGSSLDIMGGELGGSGAVAVQAGGNLLLSHPTGAAGAFTTSGTVTVDSGGALVYTGPSAQSVGAARLDSIGGTIGVTNMNGVVIYDTLKAGGFSLDAGGTFIVDTVGSISTSYGGTIAGEVTAVGPFTGDNFTFTDGSKYTHAQNGGDAPTGTWQTGSTIEITGVVGNSPANLNQDFYNFVWNSPNQNSNLDWGWYMNTINGTITVENTGASRIRMTSPGASPIGPNTITTMGPIMVTGGSFESNGSGSQDTITIESHGDITSTTSGSFAVSRGSGPMVYWNVYGDMTVNGSEVRNSGGEKANFYFAKAGEQKISLTNVTFGGGGFPLVVKSGATADFDSAEVAGSGSFAVEAGGGVGTKHANGLDGLIQTTGTVLLDDDANYFFKGTAAQVTGSALPANAANITVDNTSGVTLSGDVNVTGVVDLTGGSLGTGSHTLTAASINGASSSGYVNTSGGGALVMAGVGATETMFPVGATAFAPLWVTNHGTADDFTVGVVDDDVSAPGRGRVNNKWTVTEATAGGTVGTIKFGWMGASENATFAGNRAGYAKIVKVGTDTTEVGKGGYRRQVSSEPYTVERDSINSFSSFIVGAIGPVTSVETVDNAIPTVFAVDQNYPNPFNPSTAIRYHIPSASVVSIRIYDMLGRVVNELVNREHEPGSYSVQWNAGGFSSGMYYCTVTSGDEMKLLKMVLLK